MIKTVLEAKELCTGYKQRGSQRFISRNLSLSLYRGEVVSLIGPNGAGKSTLLRTLSGIQPALEGQIYVDGFAIDRMGPRQRARNIGVVLTGRIDTGYLTIRQLVRMGRYPHRGFTIIEDSRDEDAVDRALRLSGALSLADRCAQNLSDGEFQKAMLARALAQEPELLLLDEPAAFLDLTRRVDLMQLLKEIARNSNKAVLLTSHDLDLVLRYSDRVFLMEAGGSIRCGAPEDLVLDGEMETVFRSDGVRFDTASGVFVTDRIAPERISVDFSCSPGREFSLWTVRALARAGIEAVDADYSGGIPNGMRLLLRSGTGGAEWVLEQDGREAVFHRLYDLVGLLERWARGDASTFFQGEFD